MPSLTLLLFAILLREGSCTFSLFLPSKGSYQEQYLQPADPQQLYSSQQYSGQQYLGQQVAGQQYLDQPDSQSQYSQPQYSQDEYLSQQQQPQGQVIESFWPDNGQTNEEYHQQPQDDPSAAYRYQSSYQSTYRHQVHGVPAAVYTGYPNSLYQGPVHQPSVHLKQAVHQPSIGHPHSFHHQDPVVVPSSLPGVHQRLANPPSIPIYQLVTVGPELPVLVRLPNQQTAILPVRTIYSLPGFLERFVQRVQNYYSIYNPLEVLQIPHSNETGNEAETESPVTNSTLTEPASNSTTASSPTTPSNSTQSNGDLGLRQGSSIDSDETSSNASTLKVFEIESTTSGEAATTTASSGEIPTTATENNEVQETTTA